jgi:hypothetical protein
MTSLTDEARQHSGVNSAGPEFDSISKEEAADGVRELHEQLGSSIPRQASPSPAAHHPDRLLIQLSPKWRVVKDDIQYILEQSKGNARSKASGWVAKSYCRTRVGLLHSIREKCRTVDERALQRVEALPDWHEGTG